MLFLEMQSEVCDTVWVDMRYGGRWLIYLAGGEGFLFFCTVLTR